MSASIISASSDAVADNGFCNRALNDGPRLRSHDSSLRQHSWLGPVPLPASYPASMSKRCREDSIQQLLHRGGISLMGLQSILKTLREQPDAGGPTRKTLAAVNHAALKNIVREFYMESLSGDQPVHMTMAEPSKLLAMVVAESPALQDLYAAAWRRSPARPDRPWSLVLGFDEFVPGNKLSCDHARKTMVVSFTFLELGIGYLSIGDTWCTAFIGKESKIAAVDTEAEAHYRAMPWGVFTHRLRHHRIATYSNPVACP